MQDGQYTVYGMSQSGNCHKVRLLLEQLELPYHWVETDSLNGETRTAGFLAKNPNGKVPLLQLPDGRYLPESNAILVYLAEGSRLYPAERWQHAQVLQWLFFEQYSHEPCLAVARFIAKFLAPDHPRQQDLPRLQAEGHRALRVMEQHLKLQPFFAGSSYTVADIALFAYTDVAPEGGFDLSDYPAIRVWLERVHSQPRFVAMPG